MMGTFGDALDARQIDASDGDAGRIGRNLIPYSISFSWKQYAKNSRPRSV
jgi:hypothetical protein